MLFCHLWIFFKNLKLTEYQAVWIQIRSDVLSGLIWVQTVCKGYQLMTKVATSSDRVKSSFFWQTANSDQTKQMHRLIQIIVRRTCPQAHFLALRHIDLFSWQLFACSRRMFMEQDINRSSWYTARKEVNI